MQVLLFAVCIAVFGCSAAAPVSIHDLMQRLQQEVEQLKLSNEENIAALKQTYDEKIRRNEEKIASLEHQTQLGKHLSPQLVRSPVAFSARLRDDTSINDNPVVFDEVDLNVGDAYDEYTGVFRPPVDWVYQLTVYGLVGINNGGSLFIRQEDNVLCQGWLQSDEHSTAMCTAIAELSEGDSVRVTGNAADPSALRGDLNSGFTGFLIYDN